MGMKTAVKELAFYTVVAFLLSIPLCWVPLIITVNAFGYFLGGIPPLAVMVKMCLLASAVFVAICVAVMWGLVNKSGV